MDGAENKEVNKPVNPPKPKVLRINDIIPPSTRASEKPARESRISANYVRQTWCKRRNKSRCSEIQSCGRYYGRAAKIICK